MKTNERLEYLAHRTGYDRGFEAGYRRALMHFGETLNDMRKSDCAELRDYKLALFQMNTRHEELVRFINRNKVSDILLKELKPREEGADEHATEGLASLFG